MRQFMIKACCLVAQERRHNYSYPIREHSAQLSELIQTDESPARGLMDAARMPTAGVHGGLPVDEGCCVCPAPGSQ